MKKRERRVGHKLCHSTALDLLGRNSARLAQPVSPADIADYETALGLPLPAELVDLLAVHDGAKGPAGEEWLWPLSKIGASNAEMRADEKLQSGFMPFQDLLFFASFADANLLGFRVLPSEIDQQVLQWCKVSDSRKIIATCLGSWFERLFDKRYGGASLIIDGDTILGRYHVGAIEEISVGLSKFFETNSGVPETTIESFERESGLTLPAELKALYRLTNGVWDDCWTVFPLEKLLEVNEARRLRTAQVVQDADPFYQSFESMFFFGEEGNGDLYGFAVISGNIVSRVYEWDHESDSRVCVGANLLSFLSYLIEFKEEEESEDVILERHLSCEAFHDDDDGADHDEHDHDEHDHDD